LHFERAYLWVEVAGERGICTALAQQQSTFDTVSHYGFDQRRVAKPVLGIGISSEINEQHSNVKCDV